MKSLVSLLFILAACFLSPIVAQDQEYPRIKKEFFNKYFFEGELMKFSEMEPLFNTYSKTEKIYKRHKFFKTVLGESSTAMGWTWLALGAGTLLLDTERGFIPGIIIFYPSLIAFVSIGFVTLLSGVGVLISKLRLRRQFNKHQLRNYNNNRPHIGLGSTQNGIGLVLAF